MKSSPRSSEESWGGGSSPLSSEVASIGQGFKALAQLASALNNEQFAAQLNKEFYYLFFNPNGMIASPWQSSYINDSHTLFGPSSAAIKTFYLKYGMQVTDNHLPGDHIALILSFLSKLSKLEAEADATGDSEKLQELCEDNVRVIDKNIEPWIGKFIERIESANSEIYLPIARMTKDMCEFDRSVLESDVLKERK